MQEACDSIRAVPAMMPSQVEDTHFSSQKWQEWLSTAAEVGMLFMLGPAVGDGTCLEVKAWTPLPVYDGVRLKLTTALAIRA